jgi:hypothetical protein
MNDEQRSGEGTPAHRTGSHHGLTRRRWLAVTTAGVLATPPAIALVRWAEKPKPVRVSIEGPFKEYGSVSLEDLKLPDECQAFFQPERLELSNRPSIDSVFVLFTFKGKEDPSRVLHVECIAIDHRNQPLARAKGVFHDPRIEAKKPQQLGVLIYPSVNISLDLPKGTILSSVRSIDLLVRQGRAQRDGSG